MNPQIYRFFILGGNMKENLLKLQESFDNDIKQVKDLSGLNDLRVNYLGKKSELNSLSSAMRDLSVDAKKEMGKLINDLKVSIERKISSLKDEIERISKDAEYITPRQVFL